jgi:hypothetical protein
MIEACQIENRQNGEIYMVKCAEINRRVNWQGNQPIIHFLRRWIPLYFPEIANRGNRGKIHRSGVGGYNREINHTRGAHEEGRAADIYVNANRPYLRAIGDGLFRIFIEHSDELGIENVTWNRQTWDSVRDAGGAPRNYDQGDPHTNHLHVSFTCEGSQQQPTVLLTYLEGLAREVGTFPVERF